MVCRLAVFLYLVMLSWPLAAAVKIERIDPDSGRLIRTYLRSDRTKKKIVIRVPEDDGTYRTVEVRRYNLKGELDRVERPAASRKPRRRVTRTEDGQQITVEELDTNGNGTYDLTITYQPPDYKTIASISLPGKEALLRARRLLAATRGMKTEKQYAVYRRALTFYRRAFTSWRREYKKAVPALAAPLVTRARSEAADIYFTLEAREKPQRFARAMPLYRLVVAAADESHARRRLALIHMARGEYSAAVRHLRRLVRQYPTRLRPRNYLAYIYKKEKKYAKAARLLREAVPHQPSGQKRARAALNVACFWALAGQADEAFTYLRQAEKNGYRNLSALKAEKDLKPLHSDPRFKAMVRRLRRYRGNDDS